MLRNLIILIIYCTAALISAQTIAFGSCHKVNDPNSDIILTSIANENPDAFIWLGDMVYGKDGDPDHLSKQFKILKSKSSYQNLLNNTVVYGTWDDHDYGLNNTGREYRFKDRSRVDLLLLNIPDNSPAYSEVVHTNHMTLVQILNLFYLTTDTLNQNMLQNPTTPLIPDYKGTLLGEQQWVWLENILKNSSANVHIIASEYNSCHQIIGLKMANYPNEFKRFVGLLQTTLLKTP